MDRPSPAHVELDALTALFFTSPDSLGRFTEVRPADMPDAYRKLLAHEHHMTVTVEAQHGCPVAVRVLDTKITPRHYARKILLSRTTDSINVQFGIMRVCLEYLAPQVRTEIEQAQAPLGRILIEHDVLRTIQLESLYRVEAGPELASLFNMQPGATTYGRTACIFADRDPAVELLEIVTPC